MKRIIACAAAILLVVSPAHSMCQSLVDVVADFEKAKITKDMVVSLPDRDLGARYLAKAGITPPGDLIGVLFVTGEKGVVVGVVDPGLCVSAFSVIPHEAHKKALESLYMGI